MDMITMLNNLEEHIANAKNVPLSNKKMLDAEEIAALIDDLKVSIPDEIKQSQLVLEREAYILEDAKKNAGLITNEAEETAKKMVEEHEIVKKANEKADEILEAARYNAKEIRDGAMNYASDMLRELQRKMQEQLGVIEENLKEFQE